MDLKVWAVAHMQGIEVTDISVFDNKADAENYAHEMSTRKIGSYQVLESVLNSRASLNEAHLVELPEFNSECVECLVDSYDIDQVKFDADECAAFLEKHKEEFQHKADEMVQDYLKKELHDYLLGERIILG